MLPSEGNRGRLLRGAAAPPPPPPPPAATATHVSFSSSTSTSSSSPAPCGATARRCPPSPPLLLCCLVLLAGVVPSTTAAAPPDPRLLLSFNGDDAQLDRWVSYFGNAEPTQTSTRCRGGGEATFPGGYLQYNNTDPTDAHYRTILGSEDFTAAMWINVEYLSNATEAVKVWTFGDVDSTINGEVSKKVWLTLEDNRTLSVNVQSTIHFPTMASPPLNESAGWFHVVLQHQYKRSAGSSKESTTLTLFINGAEVARQREERILLNIPRSPVVRFGEKVATTPPPNAGVRVAYDQFVLYYGTVAPDAVSTCEHEIYSPTPTIVYVPTATPLPSRTVTLTQPLTPTRTLRTATASATATRTQLPAAPTRTDTAVVAPESRTASASRTLTDTEVPVIPPRLLTDAEQLALNVMVAVGVLPLSSEMCTHSLLFISRLLFVATAHRFTASEGWATTPALAPTRLADPDPRTGTLIGNFVLLCVVALLTFAADRLAARVAPAAAETAAARHYLARFPSTASFFFVMLYPMVCLSCFSVIAEGDSSGGRAAQFLAVAASAICLVVPLKLRSKTASLLYKNKAYYAELNPSLAGYRRSTGALATVEVALLGRGEWVNTPARAHRDSEDAGAGGGVVSARALEYASALRGRRPGYGARLQPSLEYALLLTLAVVSFVAYRPSARPQDRAACFCVLGALVLALQVAPLCLRPFAAAKDMVLAAVEGVLLSSALFCVGSGYFSLCPEEGVVYGERWDAAKTLFSVMVAVAALALVLDLAAVAWTHVARRRRALQRWESLREEGEAETNLGDTTVTGSCAGYVPLHESADTSREMTTFRRCASQEGTMMEAVVVGDDDVDNDDDGSEGRRGSNSLFCPATFPAAAASGSGNGGSGSGHSPGNRRISASAAMIANGSALLGGGCGGMTRGRTATNGTLGTFTAASSTLYAGTSEPGRGHLLGLSVPPAPLLPLRGVAPLGQPIGSNEDFAYGSQMDGLDDDDVCAGGGDTHIFEEGEVPTKICASPSMRGPSMHGGGGEYRGSLMSPLLGLPRSSSIATASVASGHVKVNL